MKDYYAYYEIIFGLKKEYLKNYLELEKLKKLIKIDGDNTLCIRTQLNNDPNEPSKLIGQIYKKQIGILKRIKVMSDTCSIVKKNNHYTFDNESSYIPKIEISDQESFDKIVSDLYCSPLMNLPEHYERINDFQALNLDGDGISLWTDFNLINKSNMMNVTYSPTSDSINFYLQKGGSSYLGERLLTTEIPKYKIHPKYKEIIDANFEEDTNIWLEDSLCSGKSEFIVNKYQKSYVLTKKK